MLDTGNKYKRSLKQSIDWVLVGIYLVLIVLGIVNIYAAIHSADGVSFFSFDGRSGKQLVWMGTSFFLAFMILFVISPRLWEPAAIPMYLAVLVLLVVVIFVSKDVKGSHSWFEFGPVKFQPAEISKITTSLMLAMVMSRPNFKLSRIKDFLTVCAVVGIPMLAILGESETGSALVYVGFIFALYREGLSGWFLVIIGMAIVLLIMTLTAGPYASILTLIALVSLIYSLEKNRFGKWLVTDAIFLLVMALFPTIWNSILNALIPGASLAMVTEDPSVKEAILCTTNLDFLLLFKPLYLLLAVIGIGVPIYAVKAFREAHPFTWYSLACVLAGVVLVFSTNILFEKVLQDHQRKRIEVLLGLKEDPAGVGYNVNQSMIAIGSGGLFGKGYLQGTQTAYGFVPEQSTDFIFCTVGEEWGFAGCLLIIMLYVALIWRILHDAEDCRESFTRIYGYCVACCIFMHLFINVGMTIGLMPVIGIPLPLLSYGGSSLWAFTILIFIFLALYRQEKKYF